MCVCADVDKTQVRWAVLLFLGEFCCGMEDMKAMSGLGFV